MPNVILQITFGKSNWADNCIVNGPSGLCFISNVKPKLLMLMLNVLAELMGFLVKKAYKKFGRTKKAVTFAAA